MGLITYALLVVGGWIAAFMFVSEMIKEDIGKQRAEYAKRTRWSTATDPDGDDYPWPELICKVALIGLVWTFLALIPAFFWKITWFAAICAVLYWKVPAFRTKADAAWARIKNLKASVEAKLRG